MAYSIPNTSSLVVCLNIGIIIVTICIKRFNIFLIAVSVGISQSFINYLKLTSFRQSNAVSKDEDIIEFKNELLDKVKFYTAD